METLTGIVAVIVVMLVIASTLFVTLSYLLGKKTMAEDEYADLMILIGQLRNKRYKLTKQFLAMFGSGTDAASRLQEVIDVYPKVTGDDAEQEWESVFLPLIGKFVDEARMSVSPQLEEPLKLALAEFADNERMLREAREECQVEKQLLVKYSTSPWNNLIGLAEFFVNLTGQSVEKYNQAKDAYDEYQEAREARKQADMEKLASTTTKAERLASQDPYSDVVEDYDAFQAFHDELDTSTQAIRYDEGADDE